MKQNKQNLLCSKTIPIHCFNFVFMLITKYDAEVFAPNEIHVRMEWIWFSERIILRLNELEFFQQSINACLCLYTSLSVYELALEMDDALQSIIGRLKIQPFFHEPCEFLSRIWMINIKVISDFVLYSHSELLNKSRSMLI